MFKSILLGSTSRICFAPPDGKEGGVAEEDSAGTEGEGEADEAEAAKDEGEGENKDDSKEAEGETKPKPTPWFQRRIDELTREKHEARRQAEQAATDLAAANATLEALRKDPNAKPAEVKAAEKDVEALAEQKAEAKVEAREFNSRCDSVFEAGNKAYEDFKETLAQYKNLGGLTQGFLQVVLETDSPEEVLYTLGKDLDEAARIMTLPPIKMAVALAKIAARPQDKGVSKAPTPVKLPRGGAQIAEKDPDKMTQAEFNAWREKTSKINK